MYIRNLNTKYHVKNNNFDIFENVSESLNRKYFILGFRVVYVEYNTQFTFDVSFKFSYSPYIVCVLKIRNKILRP